MRYSFSETNERLLMKSSVGSSLCFLLAAIVVGFVGLRPQGTAFVDMNYYAYVYNNIYDGVASNYSGARGEWLFYEFGNLCKRLGFSDTMYFLSIAVVYFGLMLVACWRLMRNNLFVAFLFCLASLSCFTYAVNGMRNGMACSVAMMAICLLTGNQVERVFSILLMFCAYNIHHSTALPCLCALAAMTFVKEPKFAIAFWVFSILISIVAGNAMTELFVGLDFDDRMEQYANLPKEVEDMLIADQSPDNTGFRLDFLIYSAMPVLMAWYVTVKRNFQDNVYNVIATTYVLANAFWVMVIRSEQSNRFAYLSWFLYPLVIAYPLLRMDLWEDQDRKTALILFVYVGFTFFMDFVYYG